ncbi:MAG: hypothetical protein KAR20_00070, partial [Candidatus Heimdallarchaeota archaeon]|nr:hypothetical protein [Candidatus Heimdallarchaeota archaeon]
MSFTSRNENVSAHLVACKTLGEEELLKCPVCDYFQIHMGKVIEREEGKYTVVEIPMSCEFMSHEWIRTYQYGKGVVYHYDVIISAVN